MPIIFPIISLFFGGGIGVCYMDHRYVSEESCFQDFADTFGLPDVYEDAFLHVRRSSGRYLKPRISFLPTFCVLGQGLWLLHCISSRGVVCDECSYPRESEFRGRVRHRYTCGAWIARGRASDARVVCRVAPSEFDSRAGVLLR